MADLNTYLRGLPQGNRPWDAWKTRELYLQKILRKGSYSEEEKQRIIANYIGPEPENVDVSNTVSGWLDRTAAMTKNSAMIGVNQIRQLWNEQEVIGDRDAEDAKEAYDDISYYQGLQSSIPRDSGVGGVAQDVISSLPSLIENLAASVTAGYAGAKIGTAVGTMVAPGAGSAIGATVGFVSGILAGLGVNASMEGASAFDDNLRNEEIKKRLEAKYGNNPALVEQAQRAIAMETAEAIMVRNIVDPTNIASAMLTTKGGQLFKGFLVSKVAPKANRFPNKYRVTRDALGGAATEAVQEGYQDALQQTETLYQIAKLDAEADPNSEKIPDRLDVVKDIDYGRVGYSALVGGIAGGGFTGSRSAIGKFADGKREKIRQEIRNAIDSGDLDQFNAVRDFYPIDSPERVIIEQEIKDIREGIHVDHRVDKDLTRYDMRNELANAMAEGQSGFEAFIKKNRNNPLFADVVNDYFDKLRTAEISAKQQADLERMRNQLLIGFDPMVGTESDETPTQRGTELPDLKYREGKGGITDLDEARKVTPGDPSGRYGGNQGIVVDQSYTPPDFAQRTERKGPPKRLPDFTQPVDKRDAGKKPDKEPEPVSKEDFNVDKATRVQLIDWIRQDDVDKGTYDSQEEANKEYKRLLKRKDRGGESVEGLKAIVRSRMTKQEETKVEPAQQAKPDKDPDMEGFTDLDEDFDTLTKEEEELERIEKVSVELLRKEFLYDFANKDVGGQKILRNKDNSFKEIVFTKGDEQIAYTKEDLEEMGYLSNNKENFLEGKVRNDLSQQPEPEVLTDTNQQAETKEESQEQVVEKQEDKVQENVVDSTKVETEETDNSKVLSAREFVPNSKYLTQLVASDDEIKTDNNKAKEALRKLQKKMYSSESFNEESAKQFEDELSGSGLEHSFPNIQIDDVPRFMTSGGYDVKTNTVHLSNDPTEWTTRDRLQDPAPITPERTIHHEVGHWGHFNVLTGDERIQASKYINENKEDVQNLILGEPGKDYPKGKFDDLDELFAEMYSNYIGKYKYPNELEPFFNKISSAVSDNQDAIAKINKSISDLKKNVVKGTRAEALGSKQDPEPETEPEQDTGPDQELMLRFMSTLTPPQVNERGETEVTYDVETKRGRNNAFEGVEVTYYDRAKKDYEVESFSPDEARTLGIVDKANEVDQVAVQEYADQIARVLGTRTDKEPAKPLELVQTETFATGEEDVGGIARPTKEDEARLKPVNIESAVSRQVTEDEDAQPELKERGFETNEIAYIKEDGTVFINEELKALGVKSTPQIKALARMVDFLGINELKDLDGVTFTKGAVSRSKNNYGVSKEGVQGNKEQGISPSLLNRLQEYASKNDINLIVVEKGELPKKLDTEYKTDRYPQNVLQALTNTFGTANIEGVVSDVDNIGAVMYLPEAGKMPERGETVTSPKKLFELISEIAQHGIADGFVAPLYVETQPDTEVQVKEGVDQITKTIPESERGETTSELVEGEHVLNITLDTTKSAKGVKGEAQPMIRIPIKAKYKGNEITTDKLVAMIDALRSPASKSKILLDRALYSIAPNSEVGTGRYDKTVIDEAVAQFTRQYRGGSMLNYKVYDSPQQAQEETGIEFNRNARGALVGDQVYLFASNLKDAATARKVIFHESIGHYGIRNVLGNEQFNLFLNRVIAGNQSEVRAKAEQYLQAGVFKKIGDAEMRIAAEEIVAEAAEGRANRTVIQRIVEAIKEFFAKHFGTLETNEIKSMVMRAEKAFRTGDVYFGADRSVFGPAFDARFALGVYMNQGQIPEGLQRSIDIIKEAMSLRGTDYNTFEQLHDDYRRAIRERDINIESKIRKFLNEATKISLANVDKNSGFYVLPDGKWRFHVNDFDDNAEPLFKFPLLEDEWYLPENNQEFGFDLLFKDADQLERMIQNEEVVRADDTGQDGEGIPRQMERFVFKLKDFIRHEQLEKLYPEIWNQSQVIFEMPINRPKKFTDEVAVGDTASKSMMPYFFTPKGEKVKDVMTFMVNGETSIRKMMSSLQHEIVHGIQDTAGLAEGGSPKSYDGYKLNTYSDIREGIRDALDLLSEEDASTLRKYIKETEALMVPGKLYRTARSRMASDWQLDGRGSPSPLDESTVSLWNIYHSKGIPGSDDLKNYSGVRSEVLNRELRAPTRHSWYISFIDYLKDKARNDVEKTEAKAIGNAFKDIFHPRKSDFISRGGGTKRRVPILDKRSFLQEKKTGGIKQSPWSDMEDYMSLLGEAEARDHQERFLLAYTVYGEMKAWEKKNTDPRTSIRPQAKKLIDEIYEKPPLYYGKKFNIFKNYDSVERALMTEDVLTVSDPVFDIEDLLIKFSKNQNPKESEIRFSIASEREPNSSAPTWMSAEEQAVFNKFGNPHAGKGFKEKFEKWKENWWTKVRQGMFDKFAPLKFLSDKSYMLARMSRSTDGPFSAMFSLGHIFWDDSGAIDVNTNKKSFVESMRPLGNELDTFLRWVASNRAYELKKGSKGRDALQFLTDAEIAVGMNFNRGTTINAETGQRISRKKLFDDVLKDFQAVQNSVLDLAVKSGAVSIKNAQIWKDQFYVPFYRVFDEEPNKRIGPNTIDSLVGQDAVKRLRGSDRGLADLLNNTLMNMHHLIDVSLKNRAASESVSDLMKIDGAVRLGKYPINNEAMQEYLENADGLNNELISLVQPENAQTIYIRENGERVYYRISDPMVLESLMAMNSIQKDNAIYKVLRGSKRWFTYAVTADPDFKIANLLRDTIGAIAVAPTSYNPLSNLSKGWSGTKKDSKTYARLVAGGGSFLYGNVSGTDPTSEGARRLIKQGVREEFILDSPEKMGMLEGYMKKSWSKVRGAWGKYEDLGSRLENVNRAALYQKLRKDGKSHLEASFQARDLMDFSNSGTWGTIQYLAQWSPFLNARLQGMYKLGRAATSKEQRGQFATTVFWYTVGSLALYLTHMDDEDFKEREEWDRDTYHWFKLPGFDTALRIPKAFEIGTITTMAERMAEQMLDDEADGKLLRERMWHAVTDTLAMDVRPQLLRPLMDIYANKNPFTGRAIESQSMQNLSIEERRDAYTSETMTFLSRLNADVIGWDKVNLSPKQLEYAVQGYFAWLGTSVIAATDSLFRMADGKEAPDNGIQSIPVIGESYRRFFVDTSVPRRSTKYSTQFYEQMKEMNQTFSSIRELRQLGEIDRALEVERDNAVLLRYRTSYNRLQRNVNKYRTQMQRIANDPNMDGDLKANRINKLQALINANIQVLQRRTNQRLAEAS